MGEEDLLNKITTVLERIVSKQEDYADSLLDLAGICMDILTRVEALENNNKRFINRNNKSIGIALEQERNIK